MIFSEDMEISYPELGYIIYEITAIIKTACHVARLPPANAIDSIRISHR